VYTHTVEQQSDRLEHQRHDENNNGDDDGMHCAYIHKQQAVSDRFKHQQHEGNDDGNDDGVNAYTQAGNERSLSSNILIIVYVLYLKYI
jgi:hypothetical protein